MELKNKEKLKENTMVGYWHGDSYCMQLVLRQIASDNKKVKVIVTADKRGNTIEKMIEHFGAQAIRLPDGLKMRPFFRDLRKESKASGDMLAASLDGPLGPPYEPKKLLFLLAAEADKEMVYIHFHYSRVIRLKHRWDRYVIPLPFSRITAKVEELGKISGRDLQNFNEYKRKLIY